MRKRIIFLCVILFLLCFISSNFNKNYAHNFNTSKLNFSILNNKIEKSSQRSYSFKESIDDKKLDFFWDSVIDIYGKNLPLFKSLDKSEVSEIYKIDTLQTDGYLSKFPLNDYSIEEILVIKLSNTSNGTNYAGTAKLAMENRLINIIKHEKLSKKQQDRLTKSYKIIENNGYILFVISNKKNEIVRSFISST